MNKNRAMQLVAFVYMILAIGCTKIPNHAHYIPKDALLVGAVDMNKLGKKMIWNAITGSELFDEMQKDFKNEKSKEAMKDFSSVGLNQNSTIYFFYTGSLRRDSKICFLVGMKNQSQFEEFIQKNLQGVTIQSKSNYKSAQIESSVYAAWNKDVAMFFPLGKISDSVQANIGINTEFNTIKSVEEFLATAFNIDKEKSITSLAHFKDLQKSGHDVSFWANYEEIFNQNQDLNTSEMQAFIKKDYFKDAALATGVDFEKGATEVEMDYYMSDDLANIYKKYSTDNVNADLIKRIPSKDIAMMMSYNLKPQMIQDFLKKFNLDGLANLGLMMMGTSMDKLASTFKGDMVFAITDLNLKDTVKKIPNSDLELVVNPEMNFTFAMSIQDESAVEKFLNKGVKENVLTKNGNVYAMASSESAIIKNKDLLVFSSKQTMAQQYVDGGSNAKGVLPGEVWKNVTSSPIGLYIDINKILQFLPDDEMNEDDKLLMEETKKMFTYFEMHGGHMKNNANHLEGNLFFTNKDENSLLQIINLAMKVKKNADKNAASKSAKDTSIVL